MNLLFSDILICTDYEIERCVCVFGGVGIFIKVYGFDTMCAA